MEVQHLLFSNDDFKFAELPTPRIEYSERVKNMPDMFTGQHEKILLKVAQTLSNTLSIDGEQFRVKQKNLTELDRLSLVVTSIDD